MPTTGATIRPPPSGPTPSHSRGSGNNDSASVLDPFSTDGSQAAALNGDGNFASVFGDNDSASASGWYHVYLGNNIAEVFGTGKLG